MTVEDAKTKECRQIFASGEQGRSGVNISTYTQVPMCSGDACMSWRWFDLEIKDSGYCGRAPREGAE